MKKKVVFVVVLAALVAVGAFAQRVGDVVQVNGQNWTVLTLSGDTMVLQRGGGTQQGSLKGGGGTAAPSGNSNFPELNGNWLPTASGNFAGGGANVTFSGTSGYMATVGTGSLWESAKSLGHIRAGQEVVRYIASTGTNTWSCEMYCLNATGSVAQNNLTVTGYQWRGGTITFDPRNGNLRIRANNNYDATFRKQ